MNAMPMPAAVSAPLQSRRPPALVAANAGIDIERLREHVPVVRRKIKAGQSIDGETVIENGLTAGERVIVAGQYRVEPGSAVTTTVADSEPSDGKTR